MYDRPIGVTSWLTQGHIDYIIAKQELYPYSLTEDMKKLLVGLTTQPTKAFTRSCDVHQFDAVTHNTFEARAELTLPAWRITSETLLSLLKLVTPSQRMLPL